MDIAQWFVRFHSGKTPSWMDGRGGGDGDREGGRLACLFLNLFDEVKGKTLNNTGHLLIHKHCNCHKAGAVNLEVNAWQQDYDDASSKATGVMNAARGWYLLQFFFFCFCTISPCRLQVRYSLYVVCSEHTAWQKHVDNAFDSSPKHDCSTFTV